MEIAAATLAGNAYGARDNKKHLARIMLPLEIGLMIVSGTALFMLAPLLMGVFSSSAEVIALGTTVLRMVAVSEPFFGFYIIVQGVMLGVGKTFPVRRGRYVAGAYCGHLYLHSHFGLWLGIRLGLHDSSQYADVCAVPALLHQRQLEPHARLA